MKSTSLDLSDKLSSNELDVFRQVERVTSALGLNRHFVVGAQARDMILRYGHNLPSPRMTNDVDFAIAVESWDEFAALRDALIVNEEFRLHPTMRQRLISAHGAIIDLVPFGSLEHPSGTISWPPDYSTVMSTIGFAEAYDHALQVRLANDLTVRVASLAGFSLLKIVAWHDRHYERDAQDIGFVMRHYLDAGNQERLYGEGAEYGDLLDEDFDYEMASARMLGRDIAKLLTTNSRAVVEKILTEAVEENGTQALATAMVRNNANFHGDLDAAISMLIMLQRGIHER